MLRSLNHDRKIHGLQKLRMQSDLRRVARRHSRDMARQDYFAHENKAGDSPADRNKLARVPDPQSNSAEIEALGEKVGRE